MPPYTPNEENLTSDNVNKIVYHYGDDDGI